jgi:hypothetical protein
MYGPILYQLFFITTHSAYDRFFSWPFFQQLKASRNEYLKLKGRVENLQRTQRQAPFFVTWDNLFFSIKVREIKKNIFLIKKCFLLEENMPDIWDQIQCSWQT